MLDQGRYALSDEARLWFQAGLAACDLQDYERAIAHFDQVLQLDSNCWQVWYERGLAAEALAYYEAALASYQTALRLHPPEQAAIEIGYHQGDVLHYGLSQYEQAVIAYDQVLQRDPHHALAWLHRGNAQLYGLHRPHDAIISYNHALSLDPDCDLLWRNRGNALVELGLYQTAILNYDRAIALNPNDTANWQAKALAVEQVEDASAPPEPNPAWYGQGYWDAMSAVPTAPQEEMLQETHLSIMTLIQRLPATSESSTIIQDSPIHASLALRSPTSQIATCLAPALLIHDSRGRRQMQLTNPCYSIGRDPSNDIQLYSKFVSRHHAVLVELPPPRDMVSRRRSPIYQVQDGDGQGKRSTNGLVINGRKCRDWTLRHGDIVMFGPKVWMRYVLLENSRS